MPNLSKKLSKVNFSLQYDTITLYPTVKTKCSYQNFSIFITACGKMGLMSVPGEPDSAEIANCLSDLTESKQYDRFIHRYDADHNLYHQDEFKLEDNHFHLKCKSMLNHEKLEAIVNVAAKYDVMTKEEAAEFLADFDKKYKVEIEAMAASLTVSKNRDVSSKAIHAFIRTCGDLDTLVYLHQALLSPKYEFLRAFKKGEQDTLSTHRLWKAQISQDGTLAKSSKAWAKIEKSFELAMIHILDTTCRVTPELGQERARELRSDNAFFGIKRHCEVSESKPQDNTVFKLLTSGDAEKLEQEYARHFRKYG